MVMRLSGRESSGMARQLRNAAGPIVVRPFGMVRLVRLVQESKAALGSWVREAGIWMLLIELQPRKAEGPMEVRLLPRITWYELGDISKAEAPMVVTLLGIVMLVSFGHKRKAWSPMEMTFSPMMTLVRTSH